MSFQVIFEIDDAGIEQAILGPLNKYLSIMEEELGFSININNGKVMIKDGIDGQILINILKVLISIVKSGTPIKERDILSVISMTKGYPFNEVIDFFQKKYIIVTTYDGRTICVKTINQKYYLDLLNRNDIIFATGSAGTGKTWVAVGYAISELKKNHVKKIIITRPAVEAGEKLGFLPGDLKEKVDPYLVPIYDAIYEFIGKEQAEKMIEKGVIEIAPLAYMRGRTLDNAFIILDEAQNTTPTQMKMALTRLGFNSKMVITGDITQIDLPTPAQSGLVEAIKILKSIPQIGMIHFAKTDIMRHPIVSKIIAKYEGIDNDKI